MLPCSTVYLGEHWTKSANKMHGNLPLLIIMDIVQFCLLKRLNWQIILWQSKMFELHLFIWSWITNWLSEYSWSVACMENLWNYCLERCTLVHYLFLYPEQYIPTWACHYVALWEHSHPHRINGNIDTTETWSCNHLVLFVQRISHTFYCK